MLNTFPRTNTSKRAKVAALISSVVMVAGLTGCSMGSTDTTPLSASVKAVGGIVHGGNNPVSGAAVTLWETQSTGYGQPGKSLATTTTGSDGSFSLPATACDTGQFLYLTATGGNTGGGPGTANNASLQMAALDSCTVSSAPGNVWINELSSIAAAYSLSNFITIVDNNDGLQTVGVSAPATNNSATPGCSGSGGVGAPAPITCTAAGLAHAFANAKNLVDAARFDGTAATGKAYSVPPSNPNASVPQALINFLGNVQQSCVNSGGGSSTSCTSLFTISGTTGSASNHNMPNTLQAMINFAKFPKVSSTANLATLQSPYAYFFTPTLTTAPSYTAIAIAYNGVSLGATPTNTAFGYSTFVTLDAEDNVYISSQNAATATSSAVSSLSANGTSRWLSTSTALLNPGMLAADSLGYVWLANGGTTSATEGVQGFSTTDGSHYKTLTTLSTSPSVAATPAAGLAVDQSNNVWIGNSTTGSPSFVEFTPGALAANDYTVTSYVSTTPQQQLSAAISGLEFDSNQNLWGIAPTSVTSAFSKGFVLPNSGTTGVPAYANPVLTNQLASYNGVGVALDSSNRAYYSVHSTANLITPTQSMTSAATVASLASATISGTDGTIPSYGNIDGAGIYWDANSNGSTTYSATSTAITTTEYIGPCVAAASATTCTSEAQPKSMQIDSAGSLWIAFGTGAVVEEVIGTASPTWPLLSYGVLGTKPQ